MDTDKTRFSFRGVSYSVEIVASGEYIGDNFKCTDERGTVLIFTITGRYEVELTECKGVATDGRVTIPYTIPFLFRHEEDELILSFRVVSIGESAFSKYLCRSSLKEISIPDSVISIGDDAFLDCKSLARIDIPNSVTSIGSWAFSGCCVLEEISVDSDNPVYDSRDNCNAIIETATGRLVQGCAATVIPSSVTSIGEGAFWRCRSLARIDIPDSVTSIGVSAFSDCESLKEIIIPDSVTSIGEGAFEGCRSLTRIDIPDSVTSIGVRAFSDCESLKEIIIPGSVTSIGMGAFSGCGVLEEISVDSDNPVYDSRDNCNAIVETANGRLVQGCTSTVIPSSVTSIGVCAFCRCRSLERINIPNSVVSIENSSFMNCESLKEIIIPGSVTSIGACAFRGCRSLARVGIPDSVVSIENWSFGYCESLKEIIIPSSVTSIGACAFSGCRSLARIDIPDSVISIGSFVFEDCESLTSIVIPTSVNTIGNSAFSGCTSLSEIVIPASVTTIGDWVFDKCKSFTKITVDGNNTVYDSRDNCNAIIETDNGRLIRGCTATVIPDSVISIGSSAFEDCAFLTKIVIPASVTMIEDNAFSGCTSLREISIPASVTSIESMTFRGCAFLTEIKVDGNNPVYDSRENCNAIIETDSGRLIRGCAATVIPDSVTSIGELAFSDCTSLREISIPASVTSIESMAFIGCTSLTEITVDGNNPVYDSRENCNAMIETDSGRLIRGCAATVIPDSVTSIGELAFSDCTSLKEISIPASVTSIGNSAFDDCTSLKEIYCFSTTPPEVKSLFGFGRGDVTVYVPRESVELYRYTFGWWKYEIRPMPE